MAQEIDPLRNVNTSPEVARSRLRKPGETRRPLKLDIVVSAGLVTVLVVIALSIAIRMLF